MSKLTTEQKIEVIAVVGPGKFQSNEMSEQEKALLQEFETEFEISQCVTQVKFAKILSEGQYSAEFIKSIFEHIATISYSEGISVGQMY